MKRQKLSSLVLILLFSWCGIAGADERRDDVFQVAPINALMEGLYDGALTFGELKKQGDFGIGTFEALDGEMIGLDGTFYQIRSDGKAYAVSDSLKTPFAVVVFFSPERNARFLHHLNRIEMETSLEQHLASKNIFHAIKIEGVFRYVKTRSVPRQEKPYRRLVDAAKNQTIAEFYSTRGTLVGFRFPDYMKGVNLPGYHFHFITADRKGGGHLLDCRLEEASVAIRSYNNLRMLLPKGDSFYQKDLGGEKQGELERVEKEKK